MHIIVSIFVEGPEAFDKVLNVYGQIGFDAGIKHAGKKRVCK